MRKYMKLRPKGQLTIPDEYINKLGMTIDDYFKVEVDEEGKLILTPVEPKMEQKRPLVELK